MRKSRNRHLSVRTQRDRKAPPPCVFACSFRSCCRFWHGAQVGLRRPMVFRKRPINRATNCCGPKSPFSLASTAAATPPPQPSFAANWFVSGIGHIGESDFVVIKSRDLSTQFSLFADESDPTTGVTLASVSWSEIAGKSTVILRKGTETALLEFNQAELRMAPAVAPASPGGAKPPPNAGVALVPNGTRAPLTNGANRLPNSAHRVAGIQPPR